MLKTIIKEWVIPGAIIAILYFTGLLGHISAFAQSAILQTGLMNADADEIATEEALESFNYNQKLYSQEGKLVNLTDFKEKVIFLNLWASWCGPCKAEMPGINSLYNDLKEEKDIVFIMLSIDRNEEAAHRYMGKNDYDFPYYYWNGALTEQLTVGSIPSTFVVSKEGKLIKKEVGMARYNTKSFKNFLLKEAGK